MSVNPASYLPMISMGHRYTLILASVAKWALRADNMPDAMRLQFLQHLDRMVDGYLTPEVLAIVEPMSKSGMQLVDEIKKLGPQKALDKYAEPDVFRAFLAVNPSLLRAIEKAEERYYRRPVNGEAI